MYFINKRLKKNTYLDNFFLKWLILIYEFEFHKLNWDILINKSKKNLRGVLKDN